MTHPTEADLLIRGGTLVTMDSDYRVIEDGGVAIRDGEILAVDTRAVVEADWSATETIDATGHLVVPGLINAHTHLGDVLFRGLVEGLALEPWLERLWTAEREHVRRDTVASGARLAMAEMIQGGTTCALDMFFFPQAAAEAARDAGFRLMTGPIFFDTKEPDGLEPAERLATGREFLEEWTGDSLIVPCVEPHNHLTVSPGLLEDARRLANDYGVLLHTHASETATEVGLTRERFGCTPIEHLRNHGILEGPTALAHTVHVTESDRDTMLASGAVSVHNPVSNLKLGSGIAPVCELQAAGMDVLLGTDGPVSSNDLDMWIAMRFAALLPRGVHEDPTRMPARQVVEMATRRAADALGLGEWIGSLEPGKRADLILVDTHRSHLVPLYDVYAQLVFAVGRGDVATTVIDGRVLMRDRVVSTIDVERAMSRVDEIARDVSSSL